MKRIGPGWVVVAGLLLSAGCPEAVYTLGQLPGDDPLRDASTSDGPIGNEDASGGTGGSSAGGGSGGSGGSGGTGGDGGVTCAPRRVAAQRKGLNFYLMVDNTFGIALQPVWGALTQAITAFVDDPVNAGLGVGIEFYGFSCDVNDYATPSVPVGVLPGVADSIRTSYPPAALNGIAAASAPAIEGAIAYASMLETTDPDRETDVLFISDALFEDACGVGLLDAANEAAGAVAATPSIRTHVIGIEALLAPVDLAPLDRLAVAGGTTQARRAAVSVDSAAQIQDALQLIANDANPCAFRLPADFVVTRTAIEWRASDTDPLEIWPRVPSAGVCGTERAIYRETGQSYMALCPAACDALKAAPSGTLRMREECP